MGQGFLIDTNVIIEYLDERLPLKSISFMNTVINSVPNVSIITKIELLGYNAPAKPYELLTNFMGDAIVLDLTNEVADKSIFIRKSYKIKLPDAIIAATALVNNLTLITRNVTDFKKIAHLQLIDSYKL